MINVPCSIQSSVDLDSGVFWVSKVQEAFFFVILGVSEEWRGCFLRGTDICVGPCESFWGVDL
jgi:hypothetical protein